MFELKVEKNQKINTIIFHDSYNFIPIPFSAMVKTFSLNILTYLIAQKTTVKI